jgi:uncharacterized protein (TIGR02271 family)
MKSPVNLHEGMIVHSADGAKLGKVVDCRPDGFIVEKGMFLPKSTHFEYDDVAELRGDDVYLSHERAQLADANWWSRREEAYAARRAGLKATGERTTGKVSEAISETAAKARSHLKEHTKEERAEADATKGPEEFRMPLAEEEIVAEKHTRDIGEVRVHKRVVVKQKQITVPVMHEEVRVERVAIEGGRGEQLAEGTLAEGTFVESTVTIPLHDEEVEIRKRPVIREEVRVTKRTFQEEKTATTDVRKEEIDIEEPRATDGSRTERRVQP